MSLLFVYLNLIEVEVKHPIVNIPFK
uniref:Uncharacterized protein n=1 Tax=Rhizophora mucronata TaxID=61149 RepID=A0A2P2NUF4_RHIMU